MFLIAVVALAAFVQFADAQCFDVSRAAWGASPPSCTSGIGARSRIFIHHTAGSACSTQAACAQQMRNIQSFHMNTNGWCDIGYNFLVGEDGQVYEGRGWNNLGAHTGGCNTGSIGISVIGTFTNFPPNAAAQARVQSFISCAQANNLFPSGYTLHGHRDWTATACPGNSFYPIVQGWPNYNSNPSC